MNPDIYNNTTIVIKRLSQKSQPLVLFQCGFHDLVIILTDSDTVFMDPCEGCRSTHNYKDLNRFGGDGIEVTILFRIVSAI